MSCDCRKFCQELVNFSEEILSKGNGRVQWKLFEQFLAKYIGDDTHEINVFLDEDVSDWPFTTSCSQKICSLVAYKLDEIKRCDVALSILLVDFMTILNANYCARFFVPFIWELKKGFSIFFRRERVAIRMIGALRGWDWQRLKDTFGVIWSNDFTKVLLNFGFLPTLPADSFRLIKEMNREFGDFISILIDFDPNINISFIVEEALKLVLRILFCYEVKEILKRMYLVVLLICGIQEKLRKNYNWAEQNIGCLKMYFTATRDPLISAFEVRSVLYASLKLTNTLHLFDVYCQEFEKLVPEYPVKTEPRKLTHLSRYQIRQNLTGSHLPLPAAIKKLLLPNILEKFVLGEIFDVSQNRGNSVKENSVTQSELELLISKF